MYRIGRTVVILALLLSFLSMASFADPVEITFWHRFTSDTPHGAAFDQIIKRFNETHSDIHVTINVKDPGGFFFDNYQVAILGGTPPDAMWVERSIVANLARDNMLQPLTIPDIVPEEKFLPAPYQEVIWEGKTWGVPWNTDIRGLFWNKDLLSKSGLDPAQGPVSWSELNGWSAKLTRREGGQLRQVGLVPWEGNWFLPAWTWTFGGELYHPESRQASFDSPEAVEALEWMASYLNQYTPSELATLAAGKSTFTSDLKAFEITGPAAIPIWKGQNGNLDLGMGPVPHPDGGHNGTWGGGFAVVVPRGSKHPDAAMKFAKWMGSKEAQGIWANVSGSLPTNREAAAEWVSEQPADIQRFYAQTDDANIRYKFVWLNIFNGGLEAYNLLRAGEMAPRNILEQLQPKVQGGIDEVFAPKK